MALPTYYATGTASVANGATTVTGVGTAWADKIFAGDFFYDPAQPLVPPVRIAADATDGAITLAYGWPGTALTSDPYEVLITPDSARVQERTRRLLEAMSVVEANGRGLFYQFATATTDADPGPGYLRFNNATIASATAAYLDNLDANGAAVQTVLDTWDDSGGSSLRGQLWVRSVAEPADFYAFSVTGSVVDGTGYRKLTLTYIGGSGTLSADDELMVDFVPLGYDGKFSGTETIKTAAYTALVGDVGKTIILNKGTSDTLSFSAAATLGATWMVMVKNIGAGTWTLDPNGAETIDGVATISLATGESCVVTSNGTALRSLFKVSLSASGVSNTPAGNIAATTVQAAIDELDTEKLGGTLTATDNVLLRTDGTGGKTAQGSTITVSDAGAVTGVSSLDMTAALTIDTTTSQPLAVTHTNDGAGFGPLIVLTRISASPAAADGIGGFQFIGRDSAGNATTYGDLLASIVVATDGAERASYAFRTTNSGASASRLVVGEGLYHASATGGDKGNNTINFGAVYDDNTLLTCMALQTEFIESGEVDLAKWDAMVPDHVVPASSEKVPATYTETTASLVRVVEEVDGRLVRRFEEKVVTVEHPFFWADPVYDEAGALVDVVETPVFDVVETPEQVIPRIHPTAHLFAEMLKEGFDPRDPAQYIAKLKADQALPGMPTQANWEHNRLSSGEMFSRLWLATEMLAIVVMNHEERLAAAGL